MLSDDFKRHHAAAEAALKKASASRVTNPTRQAWGIIATGEIAMCNLLLRYPDVTYGPLPEPS